MNAAAGKALANYYGQRYVETSAKDAINIDKMIEFILKSSYDFKFGPKQPVGGYGANQPMESFQLSKLQQTPMKKQKKKCC